MEILITNDDGWGAKGIMTLVRLARPFGNITVVAPATAQSGKSNAITFGRLDMQQIIDEPGLRVFTTNGTPSDCVKLGIHIPYGGKRPDLLLSGINHGSNSSVNVLYSGTMGAVFVGAENGIRSIGFSLNDMSADADFTHMLPFIPQIIQQVIDMPSVPYGMCWNVNAPVGPIAGVRTTRQCKGYWDEEIVTHQDETGTYYTLGGGLINQEPDAEDTDEWALHHGYIALTPSTIDTSYKA